MPRGPLGTRLNDMGNAPRVSCCRVSVGGGPAVTVWDDGVKDTLQGQKGLDWFFADLDGAHGDDDKVKDDKGEIVDLIYDLP
jgi:hypothetical protein